jgi:TIR domain
MDGTITRHHLFISYSHKDRKFLDQLLTHLKPLERAGRVSHWSDLQIAPGTQWFNKIASAVASARVAVLLVTPNFLASDFIHENELGPLLKGAEQGGVEILWIPVRSSSYKETALASYQALISPEKPLAVMKAERDKAWVGICDRIKESLDRTIHAEKVQITPPVEMGRRPAQPVSITITDMTKRVKRLHIEWTSNKENLPGMFQRASEILAGLRAVILELRVETTGEAARHNYVILAIMKSWPSERP